MRAYISYAVLFLSACTLVAAQNLPKLTPRQLAVSQLVNASRILAFQGIADDSLGHISIRDPLAPDTTFLITAGASTPAHVTPADIAVARINDSVVTGSALSGYAAPSRPAEIFIHSSIYQRFPNTTVSSIAYYRAEQLLPWSLFSASSTNATTAEVTASDLTGFYAATSGTAFMGPHAAPVFNAFDAEPNSTSMSVDNTIKGFALARSFGPTNATVATVTDSDGFRPLVLMRNDGATVVGTTVPETVFRFVQAAKSARVMSHVSALNSANGTVPSFLPVNATKMSDDYLRSWLLWMNQIEPAINADSARSPELWTGAGGSGSSSGSGTSNTGSSHAPFSKSSAVIAFCVYLVIRSVVSL